MVPWLDRYWVTAEDLGVPQHLLDEVFVRLGLQHSFHAAIGRGPDPDRTLRRVQAGLATTGEARRARVRLEQLRVQVQTVERRLAALRQPAR